MVFRFAGQDRCPVLLARRSVTPFAVFHAELFGIDILAPADQRAKKLHLGVLVCRRLRIHDFGGQRLAESLKVFLKLPNLVTEPLVLQERRNQFRLKITLVGQSRGLSMLRIENREAFPCRDITKDLIGCDKMIDRFLTSKPNRDGYLDSIESPKPEIESVFFQQALG